MTSPESKTGGDVYRNVKNIIDDAISGTSWMTQNILNCTSRRHKHDKINNHLLDKEESEADKSEHQTSVLGIIFTTIINGCRSKKLTVKNKKNIQERIDKAKLHFTCLFSEEKHNF